MRWTDLDLEARVWTLPREATKGDRSHEVPLAAQMIEVLTTLPRTDGNVFSSTRGERPMSGYSKIKARAEQLAGFEDWRIHDLRRTAGTGMARAGIAVSTISKVPRQPQGRRSHQDIQPLQLSRRETTCVGDVGAAGGVSGAARSRQRRGSASGRPEGWCLEMAKPQSAGDWTLTPEQLQAIFRGELGGRAAAPSIEVCGGLNTMLAELRKTDNPDWAGGEQLGPKARDASVTLRNKLQTKSLFGEVSSLASPGKLTGWHASLLLFARLCMTVMTFWGRCRCPISSGGMSSSFWWYRSSTRECPESNTIWSMDKSPRVIFFHRVIAVLGWKGISPSTVLKNLVRGRDKSV